MASASSSAAAACEAASPGVASAATHALLDSLPEDPLQQKIAKLKEEQETLRRARKDVRKQMKNTKRQQTRLRHRARLMSDEDLVSVLLMRKSRKSAADGARRGEAKAGGAARKLTELEESRRAEEADSRMEDTGAAAAPLADGSASERDG